MCVLFCQPEHIILLYDLQSPPFYLKNTCIVIYFHLLSSFSDFDASTSYLPCLPELSSLSEYSSIRLPPSCENSNKTQISTLPLLDFFVKSPHTLEQFPTWAFSPEKESDRGSNTLTFSENVEKRYDEINLIEYQKNELNKLFEMVREPNPTSYR